jgi:hypothetical protein
MLKRLWHWLTSKSAFLITKVESDGTYSIELVEGLFGNVSIYIDPPEFNSDETYVNFLEDLFEWNRVYVETYRKGSQRIQPKPIPIYSDTSPCESDPFPVQVGDTRVAILRDLPGCVASSNS